MNTAVVNGSKGRKAAVVDSAILAQAVSEVEANGALASLSDLYGRVAKKYANLTSDREDLLPITANVVAERIKDFAIAIKTVAAEQKKGVSGPKSAKAVIVAEIAKAVEMLKTVNSPVVTESLAVLAKATELVESLHTRKTTETTEVESAAA